MSQKIGPVYYNEREAYVSPQKQAEIDGEIRRYVSFRLGPYVYPAIVVYTQRRLVLRQTTPSSSYSNLRGSDVRA